MSSGIYALISEERLQNVLSTLQELMQIQIQLIDPDGLCLMRFGNTVPYCALLKREICAADLCKNSQIKAGQHAQQLGEAYIYTCHADLSHIAFPLVHCNDLLGTVIAGPFLMEEPDSTLVSSLLDRYPLTPQVSIELLDHLKKLQILPPPRVNVLKRLMDQLLSPLLPAERIMMLQAQEKMGQQARISETIQEYKEDDMALDRTPYFEKEKNLLAKVRSGNIEASKSMLNELLAFVIYTTGGKIEDVRTHAIELSTILSRVVLESGASTERIYLSNNQYITLLAREENLDTLCFLLQDILENYMDLMVRSKDGNNPYIRKALLYIGEHYTSPLTIASVAEYVGLSPNHFSALFQKAVGVKFHDYLCRIRVDESKRLLLSSDYSLTDIAIAMGFPDQSYFCKVFKRVVGLPPGQFRSR